MYDVPPGFFNNQYTWAQIGAVGPCILNLYTIQVLATQ